MQTKVKYFKIIITFGLQDQKLDVTSNSLMLLQFLSMIKYSLKKQLTKPKYIFHCLNIF